MTEKNGVKTQLPNSTRWNSQNDCIGSFLKSCQIIHQIYIEHKNDIEKEVIQIMSNAGLYMASTSSATTSFSVLCTGQFSERSLLSWGSCIHKAHFNGR